MWHTEGSQCCPILPAMQGSVSCSYCPRHWGHLLHLLSVGLGWLFEALLNQLRDLRQSLCCYRDGNGLQSLQVHDAALDNPVPHRLHSGDALHAWKTGNHGIATPCHNNANTVEECPPWDRGPCPCGILLRCVTRCWRVRDQDNRAWCIQQDIISHREYPSYGVCVGPELGLR